MTRNRLTSRPLVVCENCSHQRTTNLCYDSQGILLRGVKCLNAALVVRGKKVTCTCSNAIYYLLAKGIVDLFSTILYIMIKSIQSSKINIIDFRGRSYHHPIAPVRSVLFSSNRYFSII